MWKIKHMKSLLRSWTKCSRKLLSSYEAPSSVIFHVSMTSPIIIIVRNFFFFIIDLKERSVLYCPTHWIWRRFQQNKLNIWRKKSQVPVLSFSTLQSPGGFTSLKKKILIYSHETNLLSLLSMASHVAQPSQTSFSLATKNWMPEKYCDRLNQVPQSHCDSIWIYYSIY